MVDEALTDMPVPNGTEFTGMGGAFAALFTPFTKDDHVDEAMIERLVEYGLGNGLKGFYLTGTTGEGMLQTREERQTVVRRVVKASAGRAKVIAHVGAVGTKEALECARDAADAGADWLSSINPVFYGKSFGGTYDYYKTLSSETGLPFMVYAMAVGIDPDRDAKLFDLPNVKGMKYTGFACWDIARLKNRIGKDVVIYAGADEQALPSMSMKGVFNGCIGTSENVIPAHFARLCSAVATDRLTEAARLQAEIVRFVEVLLSNPGGNESWRKAMMRYVGFDCGSARSPNGWPLTAAEQSDLERRMDALGFVERFKV